MCYKQKCKVVSLNLAHPVHAQHRLAQCSCTIAWNDSYWQLWRHYWYRYRYSVLVKI